MLPARKTAGSRLKISFFIVIGHSMRKTNRGRKSMNQTAAHFLHLPDSASVVLETNQGCDFFTWRFG
jgi:hypothetical protein